MITLKVNVKICFDNPSFSEGTDHQSNRLQAENIEKDIKQKFSDTEIIRAVTENQVLKVKGYAYEAEVSFSNNSLLPKNGFGMCFFMEV